jgi:hypothetical protein
VEEKPTDLAQALSLNTDDGMIAEEMAFSVAMNILNVTHHLENATPSQVHFVTKERKRVVFLCHSKSQYITTVGRTFRCE